MKDEGKYTEIFIKEIQGIEYFKMEITVIGRNSEILNFRREYNPPMKYCTETGDWRCIDKIDGEIRTLDKRDVEYLRTVVFEE